VCTSLALLAFSLASLARDQQTAWLAKLATDALELSIRAHNLAEDLADWEESEVKVA
jgi:hypothetical protein